MEDTECQKDIRALALSPVDFILAIPIPANELYLATIIKQNPLVQNPLVQILLFHILYLQVYIIFIIIRN